MRAGEVQNRVHSGRQREAEKSGPKEKRLARKAQVFGPLESEDGLQHQAHIKGSENRLVEGARLVAADARPGMRGRFNRRLRDKSGGFSL